MMLILIMIAAVIPGSVSCFFSSHGRPEERDPFQHPATASSRAPSCSSSSFSASIAMPIDWRRSKTWQKRSLMHANAASSTRFGDAARRQPRASTRQPNTAFCVAVCVPNPHLAAYPQLRPYLTSLFSACSNIAQQRAARAGLQSHRLLAPAQGITIASCHLPPDQLSLLHPGPNSIIVCELPVPLQARALVIGRVATLN
jgi:hypothetical protein